MSLFWQEIRWGLRSLIRSPNFTAIAVILLALGIGASITIFGLIDAVMLRRVPVSDPKQFVVFKWQAHASPNIRRESMSIDCGSDGASPEGCSFSLPMFEQFDSSMNGFADVVALSGPTQFALVGNGPPRVTFARFVSGRFFQTTGVKPALGRALDPGDDKADAEPVAMLNYDYWQSAFGGDSSVLGRTIYLNGLPVAIVGVSAREFIGLDPGSGTEVWLPLALRPPLLRDLYNSSGVGEDVWWLAVAGRLKPGVSSAQAQAAASDLFRNRALFGAKTLFNAEDEPGVVLVGAQETLAGTQKRFSKPLMTLMVAVLVILLIACANIAGLMLARAAARERDLAVRLALGASPIRIIRQIFTESLLISMTGGALGALMAVWVTPILTTFLSKGGLWPIHFNVHVDARVLIFAAVVSILAGILCGLAPVVRSRRLELTGTLKAGSHNLTHSSRRPNQRFGLGNLLVVAQVALATVILVGASLLIFTLANLRSINPGFDADQVLIFGVDPTLVGYKGPRIQSLYRDMLNRLESLPGVVSASYSRETLLGGNLIGREIYIQGDGQNSGSEVNLLPVGPNFFETMRVPVLAGRTFTPADVNSTAKPTFAIVNEAFARQHFQDQNPLGRLFGTEKDKVDYEVVGVVGDAKYKGLREAVKPLVFTPFREGRAYFELRTTANPMSMVPAVRNVIGELDNNLPLLNIKTEAEQIDRVIFIERLVGTLSALFGLLSLVVICLGLYGLLSYEVAGRTREIGIRMALGAKPGHVLRLVVGQGIRLVAIGIVIGLAAAFIVTRYLESLLYGIHPTDPITFVGVVILLLLVAIAASYLPARRATSVDPVAALRYE